MKSTCNNIKESLDTIFWAANNQILFSTLFATLDVLIPVANAQILISLVSQLKCITLEHCVTVNKFCDLMIPNIYNGIKIDKNNLIKLLKHHN